MAASSQEELLKHWEGLGYYSRARSLHEAAKIIVREYDGKLPADVAKLRALPGIGAYTAGAIAAIAFGLREAAVDGNVERVLCRYDAVTEETGSPAMRKRIAERAGALVPADRPGAFANAMMEMGATMCTPKNPACLLCPVRESCAGFAQGIAAQLPKKPRKKAPRVERRAVLLVFSGGRVLVVRRTERMLGGLYIFPNLLLDGEMGRENAAVAYCDYMEAMGVSAAYDAHLGEAKHVFTHVVWMMEIHALAAGGCPEVEGGKWVTGEELEALPMPTAVRAARRLAAQRLAAARPGR